MTDDDARPTDAPIVFTMPSLRTDDASTQIVTPERGRNSSTRTLRARFRSWLRGR